MSNTITILHTLEEAGVDKKAADAIAEVVTAQYNELSILSAKLEKIAESMATKAEVAELRTMVKVIIALVIAILVILLKPYI